MSDADRRWLTESGRRKVTGPMTQAPVHMPAPADRTARYGAIVVEPERTAIVPPSAESWVPTPLPAYRARKSTLAPMIAPVPTPAPRRDGASPMPVPIVPTAFETTHVGGPPPRITPEDRVTSPAMIPAAATYRPPAPRDSRSSLALSVAVFIVGLAAAAGVLTWILAQKLAH